VMDMSDVFTKFKIRKVVLIYVLVPLIIGLMNHGLKWDAQLEELFCNLIIILYFVKEIDDKQILVNVYKDFLVKFDWKIIIQMLAVMLFLLGVVFVIVYGLEQWFPNIGGEIDKTLSKHFHTASTFSKICLAVRVSLITPIVEELIFRGVMLNRLSQRWGVKAGIVISSLLFALIHAEPFGKVFFAIFMCLLYLSTRNILFPIMVHSLNNLIGVIVLLTLPGNTTVIDGAVDETVLLWVGLFLIIITLPIVIKFVKQTWPRDQRVLD